MIKICNFKTSDGRKSCGLVYAYHPCCGEENCTHYQMYILLLNIKTLNEVKNIILNKEDKHE